MEQLTTLYRPVGSEELALIRKSDNTAFPPRLFWQPIFYPVLNEAYATKIARDWNARDGNSGYVTRFAVRTSYIQRHKVHQAGDAQCLEYWIPAEKLEEFNSNIVGKIEVIAEFHS